jgi:SAM-dependent methyltransferase
MATLYDSIGRSYSSRRQSDPRVAAAIDGAIGGCASILNVGAGVGSYEPAFRTVVALEPSSTMIAQRPPGAAPVIQGCAEALPFRDGSFDGVLCVLTVQHWTNQARGFSECARVARSRVVFFTIDFDACTQFWLFDYFPELLRVDRPIFPAVEQFVDVFGPMDIVEVSIPADCRDGFLSAYWKRPQAYLDSLVRDNISTFSKIGNIDSELARLERDIDSGTWHRRYSNLQELRELDLGYRLLIARSLTGK